MADAERLYDQILTINPDHPDALHMLGAIAHSAGKHERAVDLVSKAIALKPAYPEACVNLGNALKELGRLDEAAASHREALALKPDFPEAHYNLGVVLQHLGRFDEAAACYRKAIVLKPNFPESHNNLGAVLGALGQWSEAAVSYRNAIALKPDYAEAHNNLGGVLRDTGRLDEAAASFRNAIALNPEFSEAHGNLGGALKDFGRLEEAEASYRRALDINPRAFHHAIHARLLLPPILESADAVDAWRERYRSGIESLSNMPGTLDDPGRTMGQLSFYLAYHDRDDRPLMTKLHDFFRDRAPGLTFTAPHVSISRPPAAGRRIKVGFLSEYLTDHTIGKLYRGFIRYLDRRRFEVVAIHTCKTKPGALKRQIDADADKSLALPAGLAAQQQAVAAERLDALVYPDIGMTPTTYFLAYGRLAPVQAASWGHPDTTGLDTVDYFVSSAAIEPEDAEIHYCERLIRLNRLPCFYEPPAMPAEVPSRAALGLPETGTLYGCPQSLFKFHPDFDPVLAAIADGDPAGRLVLLQGSTPAWADMLKARWSKIFPVLLERTLFLPRMPMDRFLGLLARVDILLDPLHFGSGNSFYEGAIRGTPVVTWPGRFMRGRIVAGAYRQMGLADAPVAARPEDYASVALAWGRDPDRCRAFRRAAQEAAGRELLADTRAVREFEAFLEAAVASVARGEKLPAGWRPDARSAPT